MKKADSKKLPFCDYAIAVHTKFASLIASRIKAANKLAGQQGRAFAENPTDECERNKAYMSLAEADGLTEAFRLYGGIKGGVLIEPDDQVERVLFQARARITSGMYQLTGKACTQARICLTAPVSSTRYEKAHRQSLTLQGRLDGYRRALGYFDKCFNDLEVRACQV